MLQIFIILTNWSILTYLLFDTNSNDIVDSKSIMNQEFIYFLMFVFILYPTKKFCIKSNANIISTIISKVKFCFYL